MTPADPSGLPVAPDLAATAEQGLALAIALAEAHGPTHMGSGHCAVCKVSAPCATHLALGPIMDALAVAAGRVKDGHGQWVRAAHPASATVDDQITSDDSGDGIIGHINYWPDGEPYLVPPHLVGSDDVPVVTASAEPAPTPMRERMAEAMQQVVVDYGDSRWLAYADAALSCLPPICSDCQRDMVACPVAGWDCPVCDLSDHGHPSPGPSAEGQADATVEWGTRDPEGKCYSAPERAMAEWAVMQSHRTPDQRLAMPYTPRPLTLVRRTVSAWTPVTSSAAESGEEG